MLLRQLFDQETWTYTYLLADLENSEAIIIDPVVEQVERDLTLLTELGLELIYTLDTHVHADHVTGSGELRRRTGAISAISAQAAVGCADRALKHGDVISFGRYSLRTLSTPGHTSGCLTFVVDAEQTLAFTGDALFIRGCGRTDFQQGDSRALYHSVHTHIFGLPDDTIIYPGHDYQGHTQSTVREEKAHNKRLSTGVSEEDFVTLMNNLGLPHPKRIHEALPANMACGLSAQEQELLPEQGSVKELSVKSLDGFQDSLVIDVRNPEEFRGKLGHLPNAVLAPLSTLAQSAKSWKRNDPVLVVCGSGKRSAKGCSILLEMGFTNVTNLSGGMIAWQAEHEVNR